MAPGRILALLLILALAQQAAADSFSANTTLMEANFTNGSSDTLFIGNASAITASNLNTIFARWGHIPTEREGFLFNTSGSWNAGAFQSGASLVLNHVNFSSAGGNGTSPTIKSDPNSAITVVSSNNTVNVSDPGPNTNTGSVGWTTFTAGHEYAYDFDYTGFQGTSQMFIGLDYGLRGWLPAPTTSMQGLFMSGAITPNIWDSMASTPCTGSVSGNVKYYVRQRRFPNNTLAIVFFTSSSDRDNYYDQGTNAAAWCVKANANSSDYVAIEAGAYNGAAFGVYTSLSSQNHKLNGSTLWGGSSSSSGAWLSGVGDTGVTGQRYSQVRWNATVNQGNLTLFMRASNTPFAYTSGSPEWVHITTQTNLSSFCPCSTGTNMSNLSGRYYQFSANGTAVGGILDAQFYNSQTILAAADTATLAVNGVNESFIAGNLITIPPGVWTSGTNSLLLYANNTSYYNLTLTLAQGNGAVIATNAKSCYTWKNITTSADVQSITLAFVRPSGASAGNWNTTVYLNGSQNETSNRTNASAWQYSAWEDSSYVYVQNNSTLGNGSTWNVLLDFMCLNATARDADNGTAINGFTVQEIGGQSKTTTGTYIWFNGTEVVGGGTAASHFRATKGGYNFADATLDLTPSGRNYTFALSQTTSSALYTIQVVNSLGQPVPGTTVTITNLATGLQIFTGSTDGAGQVVAYLTPGTTYLFTASATGYTTLSIMVTAPAASSAITLKFGSTNNGTGITIADVKWNLTPTSITPSAGNTTLRLNSWSGTSSMVLTFWNITYRVNGSVWYFQSSCSSSFLCSLSDTANLSNATNGDTVFVYGDITYREGTTSYQDIYIRKNYTVGVTFNNSSAPPAHSVRGILNNFAQSGLTGQQLMLLAFLISVAGTVAVAATLRPGLFGSGAIMVGMLALFGTTDPPMFPWGITILLGLFVVATYFIRRI